MLRLCRLAAHYEGSEVRAFPPRLSSSRAESVDRLRAAAEVEELKDKIAQLEAALQALQSKVSDEPHPLLQNGAAQRSSSSSESGGESGSGGSPSGGSVPSSSSPSSGQSPQTDPSSTQEEEQDVLDSFGMLDLPYLQAVVLTIALQER